MSIREGMMIYFRKEKKDQNDQEVWMYSVWYEGQNGLRSDQVGGMI